MARTATSSTTNRSTAKSPTKKASSTGTKTKSKSASTGKKSVLSKLTSKARSVAAKAKSKVTGKAKSAKSDIERSVEPRSEFAEQHAMSGRNTRTTSGKGMGAKVNKKVGSFKDRQNAQPTSISPSSRK
ncbi:hypothetical protein ACES2L_11230 [Bdellovibrio bacteriovorus]